VFVVKDVTHIPGTAVTSLGRYKTARKYANERGPTPVEVRRYRRLVRQLLYKPWTLELLIEQLSSDDLPDGPRKWLRNNLAWHLFAKKGWLTRWIYNHRLKVEQKARLAKLKRGAPHWARNKIEVENAPTSSAPVPLPEECD
jgi:hypothetical protein